MELNFQTIVDMLLLFSLIYVFLISSRSMFLAVSPESLTQHNVSRVPSTAAQCGRCEANEGYEVVGCA